MAEQRMYRVTVETRTYVVASSEDEARRIARNGVETDDLMDGATFHARVAEDVPEEWRGCVPHGKPADPRREDWTAEQWLDAQTEKP